MDSPWELILTEYAENVVPVDSPGESSTYPSIQCDPIVLDRDTVSAMAENADAVEI